MNRLWPFVFMILLFSCGEVDSDITPSGLEAEIPTVEQEEEIICFINPEVIPQFPGGINAMIDFITKNLRRPQGCAEGRVFVGFTVEVDSTLSNIEVLKGIEEKFDNEAIRLVESFPAFEPGSLYGVPVRTKMLVPIRFDGYN